MSYFGFQEIPTIRVTYPVTRCRFVFADQWGNTAAPGSSANPLGISYFTDNNSTTWRGLVQYYQLNCNTQCRLELGESVTQNSCLTYDDLGRGVLAASGMYYAIAVNGGVEGDWITVYPVCAKVSTAEFSAAFSPAFA